jgi:hypothetical protein
MTEREQRLRNEVGQLTHTVQRMLKQRGEMQADLVRQREDMQEAIDLLERGEVRDAIAALRDALDYRNRTRAKRKSACAETA